MKKVLIVLMLGMGLAALGAGCRKEGQGGGAASGDMKTLSDLVAFIDLVLAPGFDVAAAERRLGPIDRWLGETAYVNDADPALRESAIETLHKKFSGIQTNLKHPLEVPWKDLTRALGNGEERMNEVDNFSGRVSYRFVRQLPNNRRGSVFLYAKRNQDPARIEMVVVRLDPVAP